MGGTQHRPLASLHMCTRVYVSATHIHTLDHERKATVYYTQVVMALYLNP